MSKQRGKEIEFDVEEAIKRLPSSTFVNEHGENFTVYSDGITAILGGDEVDAMVDGKKKLYGMVCLFNDAFSIWSAEELYKLGDALKDVSIKNGYKPEA